MTGLCRIVLATLAIAGGLMAQSSLRTWADAGEYNLATAAFQERDPNQQLKLLRQWELQYPRTEFQRERISAFAIAFDRLKQFEDAFSRAAELLKLNANDPGALLLVATVGPHLQSPSASQITIVVDAASNLQSVKLAPPSANAAPVMTSREQADREVQTILAFIRELRSDRTKSRRDPDILKDQVIESALAWSNKVRQR